jgi:hypothetical protein
LTTYTIHQLETAINWWSAREGASADRIRLCKPVSVLAEPYARLIFDGVDSVNDDALSAECRGFLVEALTSVAGQPDHQ